MLAVVLVDGTVRVIKSVLEQLELAEDVRNA